MKAKAFVALLAAAASACSTSSGGKSSSSSDTYPAFAVSAPVLQNRGGPVLAHATVRAVMAGGDPDAAKIESFLKDPEVTGFLARGVAEYGIAGVTVGDTVTLPDAPATIDDDTIQKTLASDTTTYPGGDVVYVFLYPSTTTVTRSGITLCGDIGGYHGDVARADGTSVAYAVVPRCARLGFYSGFDALTVAAGHEIAEAVTDPYILTKKPAWVTLDDAHAALSLVLLEGDGAAEIADLCIALSDDRREAITLGGWLLPRLWSNAAATKGHDPCSGGAPPSSAPYFNVEPVLTETASVSLGDDGVAGLPTSATLPVVKVKPGASAAVTLRAFSDAPALPWPIVAVEVTDPQKLRQIPITLEKDQVQNGDEITMTLSPPATLAAGSYDVVILSSGATTRVAALVADVRP